MRLSAEKRRALAMLALSPLGFTEAIMLAHGFTVAMLAELASDGLVTMETETVRAGRRPVKITQVQITDAGRRALA
jgi:hypothetical protein